MVMNKETGTPMLEDTLRERLMRALFASWAPFYDHPFFQRPFYRRIHARMLQIVASDEPTFVVDVGCGTALFTIDLARHFAAAEVVGVDISEPMLRIARKRARGPSPAFVQGSVYALPFADRSVDVVTNSISYHWYLEPRRALGEIRRVLRPGGRLLLATVATRRFSAVIGSMRFLTTGELSEELSETGFTVHVMEPLRPMVQIVLAS
jgi:ubiquinone/menaquinone biosynthesis C-methylase UbiE